MEKCKHEGTFTRVSHRYAATSYEPSEVVSKIYCDECLEVVDPDEIQEGDKVAEVWR